eukprot:CAMPEP_0202509854 /NCGR_PEP_ID=MMETSP1361-20130828/52991_1 /ASSEMBLY_ACC=CAM_ASM_000849 /TAXON_ID=210615 /ORGANISM="Staurosira complex sp., Strain CCMP2646" /LENGTH=254 /DNA_ID=CAMNT_0049144093 /DNA_START=44 /DNA_END=808 /DNA_ORIENTATION=-
MEGLRMTASLPDSPLTIKIPRATEVQLRRDGADAASHAHDHVDNDDDTILDSLASRNEDGRDLSDDGMSETMQESQDEIAAPPTIRRRRMITGNDSTLQSFSFIATNGNDDLIVTKNDTMVLPIKSQRKTQTSGLTVTPTCRAICLLVFVILFLCVLLSHYTFTEPPPYMLHENTDMTVSKKQVLLKSYLGDLQGSFASNVKLPAGGNPIDLIHLLHSSMNEETGKEEDKSASCNRNVQMTITLCAVCTIIAAC